MHLINKFRVGRFRYTRLTSETFLIEVSDLNVFQACRTPSRNPSGIDLLANYFSQLSFLETRFFSPTRQIGIFFTW